MVDVGVRLHTNVNEREALMRRSTRATIVSAVAVGVVMALGAQQANAARTVFVSTLTPHTAVAAGTVMNLHSGTAKASTAYFCAELVVNPVTGVNAPRALSTKTVTSSATRVVNCSQTYVKFSAKDSKGVLRHCPLTSADKTAGFKCGVGLGDKATLGNTSASLAIFTTA